MSKHIFTELAWEPLHDAYWKNQIHFEIEDDREDDLGVFLNDWVDQRGLDLEEDLQDVTGQDFNDLLNDLRALPYVIQVNPMKFFFPFDI